MNRQRVYERVRKHLLKQNEKSQIYDTICSYRGLRGLKCAIGVLIPNSLYSPKMEGSICPGLFHRFPKLTKYLKVENSHDIDFLQGLQQVHDHNHFLQWEARLNDFANKYHLTP